MSYFPIYIIDEVECKTEQEKSELLLSGKTRIRGCILALDYQLVLSGQDKASIYIKTHFDFAKYMNAKGNQINLFVQYRHQIFWLNNIKPENIVRDQKDPTDVTITIPLSQAYIARMG